MCNCPRQQPVPALPRSPLHQLQQLRQPQQPQQPQGLPLVLCLRLRRVELLLQAALELLLVLLQVGPFFLA